MRLTALLRQRLVRVTTGTSTSATTRDAGMTTLELITAMTISSILGAMTLFVFLSLTSGAASSVERSLSASQARVVLSSWNSLFQLAESPVREVQVIPAFEKVTTTEVIFYSSIDNRDRDSEAFDLPTKVRLSVTGGEIREQRFEAEGSGWRESPTVSRVLATGASASFVAVDRLGSPVGFAGGTYANLCPANADATVGEPGLCFVEGCTAAMACANGDLASIAGVRVRISVTDVTGAVHVYEGAGGVASGGAG